MQQHLSRLAVKIEIDQHVLLDLVMVPEVVRVELIGPMRGARVRVAREERGRPKVVAGTLVRVPWTGVRRPVIDEIEVWIEGEPAPHGSAADLPGVGRPGADAEVLAFHEIV